MITLIRPLLVTFVQTKAVKELIISLLEKLAASTDTELDDQAVAIVKKGLDM
jgi:hypothetical protein